MKRETEDCCQMFLTPAESAATAAAVIITKVKDGRNMRNLPDSASNRKLRSP